MLRGTKRAKRSTPGQRVGTKKRDMRWQAEDGSLWDSKFEYEVFRAARSAGEPVRRSQRGDPDQPNSDTVSYWHGLRGSSCQACGSTEVGSRRTYTPDLFHDPALAPQRRAQGAQSAASYYVDVKGYLRSPQRSLFRSLRKTRPDFALRIILQRDFPISKKSSVSAWVTKFLKVPYVIWNGKWPTEKEWVKP